MDQSDGAAVGGLTNADTEATIDRAVASWNDVACSHIPIEKTPDTGVDPDNNDKLHFAPFAVMNAGAFRVSQELRGTDVGGHCSIWGNWPSN